MTAYDDLILADGPILYLPLRDTSGSTAVALAGPSGTYVNSPGLNQAGPAVPAQASAFLDAANLSQHVQVADSAAYSAGTFSVEAWVRFGDGGATRSVVGKNGPGGSEWLFFKSDTNLVNFNRYTTIQRLAHTVLYERALTAAEVADRYQMGLNGLWTALGRRTALSPLRY